MHTQKAPCCSMSLAHKSLAHTHVYHFVCYVCFALLTTLSARGPAVHHPRGPGTRHCITSSLLWTLHTVASRRCTLLLRHTWVRLWLACQISVRPFYLVSWWRRKSLWKQTMMQAAVVCLQCGLSNMLNMHTGHPCISLVLHAGCSSGNKA